MYFTWRFIADTHMGSIIVIKNNVELLDLSNVPTGLYILKLANGETQKIIKQ
jgi:hypothetical protein